MGFFGSGRPGSSPKSRAPSVTSVKTCEVPAFRTLTSLEAKFIPAEAESKRIPQNARAKSSQINPSTLSVMINWRFDRGTGEGSSDSEEVVVKMHSFILMLQHQNAPSFPLFFLINECAPWVWFLAHTHTARRPRQAPRAQPLNLIRSFTRQQPRIFIIIRPYRPTPEPPVAARVPARPRKRLTALQPIVAGRDERRDRSDPRSAPTNPPTHHNPNDTQSAATSASETEGSHVKESAVGTGRTTFRAAAGLERVQNPRGRQMLGRGRSLKSTSKTTTVQLTT